MSTRNRKIEQVYKPFSENARKAFPYRSMFEITKELNKLLEDVIYKTNETNKTKKRKHN